MGKEKGEQLPVDKRRSKERIQFDFSIDALERLDHIKELTGASTRRNYKAYKTSSQAL